jgi:hypothetical protein
MSYQYKGDGRTLSDEEAARRLAVQNGLPGGRTATAGAGMTSPVIRPAAVPNIRGAEKVNGFPDLCRYPFQAIADDGGVWRLDPEVYKVTPQGISMAATQWAKRTGKTVKKVTDSGLVYVQFGRKP